MISFTRIPRWLSNKDFTNFAGELFFDAPDNVTTRFGTPKTRYGEPIAIILLGIYLLTANVVLLNLLIAIFSSTYEKVENFIITRFF